MIDRLRRALRRLIAAPSLSAAERHRLEEWARARFRLGSSDPTGDVIAVAARLIEAGLDRDEAVKTAVRIAHEIAEEAPMADGPTPERIARVVAFLEETSGTGLDYLYTDPPRRRGLLDGDAILELWKAFQEDDEKLRKRRLTTQCKPRRPEPYGFYFLFYRAAGRQVPIYVGKGSLPYRPLAHLGLQPQYFDQVMASYFGGITGRPWRTDVDQARVKDCVDRLALGFSFYALDCEGSDKKAAGEAETKFIKALHPVANNGFYGPTIKHFSLAQLVAGWPENGEGKKSLTSQAVEELITLCEDRHRHCVGSQAV